MPRENEEVYLGDAVYASFDGWHIWLRTGDGNRQRIALEPSVFQALVNYKTELYKRLNELNQLTQPKETTNDD